jgi:hypothetical protein
VDTTPYFIWATLLAQARVGYDINIFILT